MPGYKLAKCLSCGMVWDMFPPNDLKSVYSENYFVNDNPKGGYSNYFEGMNINRRTFFERVKRINKKVMIKERMLDVGSALGDSLIEARRLGWKKLYGVELSEYAAKEAKKKNLTIHNGTLISAKYESNFFDAITLQDVIEHVESPRVEVKEIYRILKPGGVFFVVTPDIGGLWHRFLGPLWYHYKPGEHIMYFSQNTLRKVLEDSGFKNIETRRTYHIMSLEYIFNRLRYYLPGLFEFLLKISRKSFVGKISFKLYTGEIEAWGIK